MASADVTAMLLAWSDGDEAARAQLIEAVYDELRRLARSHLRRERPEHSLAPTALVDHFSRSSRSASRRLGRGASLSEPSAARAVAHYRVSTSSGG